MKLHELVRHLDETLDVGSFNDAALNGLQVEAGTEVTRVAVAVDASLDAIEAAAGAGADLLICHHGLFWGPAQPLTGVLGARVRRLIIHGISLYAVHLPLDSHPTLGNNAALAQALAIQNLVPFGRYKGNVIGLAGDLVPPQDIDAALATLETAVGPPLGIVRAGPDTILRVGVISGAAGSVVEQAREANLDLLVTGEPDHASAVFARDEGYNLAFLGHYATEVFGVRALARHLEEQFELPWAPVGRSSGF